MLDSCRCLEDPVSCCGEIGDLQSMICEIYARIVRRSARLQSMVMVWSDCGGGGQRFLLLFLLPVWW